MQKINSLKLPRDSAIIPKPIQILMVSKTKMEMKKPATVCINQIYVEGSILRQAYRQADCQVGRQTGRQAERQADRMIVREVDRQTGRQADRQTGRQADRQAGR